MTAWCWRGVSGPCLVGDGVQKACVEEEEEGLVGVENIADAIVLEGGGGVSDRLSVPHLFVVALPVGDEECGVE